MFVRSLNPEDFDSIGLAKVLSQQRGFVWLDSCSSGDFSILAWNPHKLFFFEKESSHAFYKFLKETPVRGLRLGYVSYEAVAFFYGNFTPTHFKDYPLAAFGEYDTFIRCDHKSGVMEFISHHKDPQTAFHDFEKLFQSNLFEEKYR